MFGKRITTDLINRSAENESDRRNFLRTAAAAGIGVVGATALSPLVSANAATDAETPTQAATDAAVLNFALNLEYLEAEYYLHAVNGTGLNSASTTGKGRPGGVTGGRKVNFTTPLIKAYAQEIAGDERNHVQFLRKALGSAKVSRPAINIRDSFNSLGKALGLSGFDPYANEVAFLIGAFIFEDVGVTAYKGASPLITNKTYLEAAAGILAVEAYHAGVVRTTLLAIDAEQPNLGIKKTIGAISALRDKLDGPKHDDQGIGVGSASRVVPVDSNSIAFSRKPANVLNVVYATQKKATKGGFYPNGVNGSVNESAKTA